jgi:hypothetical protein
MTGSDAKRKANGTKDYYDPRARIPIHPWPELKVRNN